MLCRAGGNLKSLCLVEDAVHAAPPPQHGYAGQVRLLLACLAPIMLLKWEPQQHLSEASMVN